MFLEKNRNPENRDRVLKERWLKRMGNQPVEQLIFAFSPGTKCEHMSSEIVSR